MAAKVKQAKRAARSKSAASVTTITLPVIGKGEKYRGFVLGADGKPSHHVILLGEQLARATHDEALAFAKKLGGSLADRAEGALLYAQNADGACQKEWYWLAPLRESDSAFAWCQTFGYGYQDYGGRGNHCRVCVVRRAPIQ